MYTNLVEYNQKTAEKSTKLRICKKSEIKYTNELRPVLLKEEILL